MTPARALPRRKLPRSRTELVLVLLVLAAVGLHRLFFAAESSGDFPYDSERLWRVERVVDGDTVRLEGGQRVRLIGVDTPELYPPELPPEPLAQEATDFTRQVIEGRRVRLDFDRERRDQYRRILAYVYVGDQLLNEELIRAGFSPAVTRFPYRAAMKRRFQAAEAEARAARRGIWAEAHSGSPSKRRDP